MTVRSRKKVNRSRRSSLAGKGRRNRIWYKTAILLSFVFCSFYAVFKLNLAEGYFVIEKVSVNRTSLIPQAHLDSLCRELLMGRSILSDFGEEKKAILDEPLVKSARLVRKFPDCVKVIIKERKPVALVNSGEFLPVDDEGVILPVSDTSTCCLNLPIITLKTLDVIIDDDFGRTTTLDRDGLRVLDAVLTFRRLAPDLLPELSEFTLNGQGKVTLVTLKDGIKVVMGRRVEEKNIRYLQWMLLEIASRGEKPALVDLSFQGQIIVRNSKGG